jgi:uncharacterized membrane protein YgcG
VRCPYCRVNLIEYTPECPNCKLTLQRVNTLLGAVPHLMPGLVEAASILTAREVKSLKKILDRMKQRFPQINNHLIVRNLPDKYPLELYLFWLFNTAGLSEAAHRGPENRDILVLLDLSRKQAGITVGYGLAQYLPTILLDELLEKAAPLFAEQQWYAAFAYLYKELDRLLEIAAKSVNKEQFSVTRLTADSQISDY